MMKQEGDHSNDQFVSASNLAKMGRCEKLMQFERLQGSRTDRRCRRAMEHGRVEHERFHRDGLAAVSAMTFRRKPCLVCNCMPGMPCSQTDALRRFRDEVLQPTWWGRGLVSVYYLLGPCISLVLRRWPRFKVRCKQD